MSAVSGAASQVENVTVVTPVAGTSNTPESEPPAPTSADSGSPQWIGVGDRSGGEPVAAVLAAFVAEPGAAAVATASKAGRASDISGHEHGIAELDRILVTQEEFGLVAAV